MKLALLVGLGGGLGSIARYLSQRAVAMYLPIAFPFGTFLVNILGCFLIGVFYGISDRTNVFTPEVRLLLTTGFCGGFTTFSAFTLDSLTLLRDTHHIYFALYVGLSVMLGIAATFLGIALIKLW